MSGGSLISTEKQAEMLQSADISKISLRNEKTGRHITAQLIEYGYYSVFNRSTKVSFSMARLTP